MPVSPPTVPLSAIRQPALLYDAGRRICAANDRAEALAGRPLVGLSPPDLIRIFQITRPDGTALSAEELPGVGAQAGREAVDVPLAITVADGRTLEILATASPIREDGAISGALVLWQTATGRGRADEQLAASEARYRRLFETMTEGFLLVEPVLDDQGVPISYRYLDANPALERLTHLKREEIIGRDVRDVLPGVEPYWIETFGRVALTGEPAQIEQFSQDLGGWYNVYVYSPAPGTAALVYTNITARKETERALAGQRELLERLVETVPVMISIYDPALGSFHLNRAVTEVSGWTDADAADGRLLERIYPDPAYRAEIEEYMRSLAPGFRDLTMTAKDGSTIPSSWANFRLSNDVQVGVGIDLRERARAEEALRRSNEELQRFAYVASHDLQEPLRSIVSFSQLLERRYGGRLDADADDYIGFIVEGGTRMQRLIADLLQVSRVETGAKPPEPTDAGEVAAEVVRSMDAALREAGATVEVGPLPRVAADPAQLALVVQNLIGNAVKYRRPDVAPLIRIAAVRVNGMVEFAVQDNGIGIEAEYFDRIFEMFRRLHTHDAYEGTGIGLAVVKRIVDRHGGMVRVESAPGEGSTFYFTLPAA